MDDIVMEALCETERRASDRLAATIPATLEGAAAALAYVRLLRERDDYFVFDDYYCYAFIASIDTAVRRALTGRPS